MYSLSLGHQNGVALRNQEINSGTELDDPHEVSALDDVAFLEVADNSPRH